MGLRLTDINKNVGREMHLAGIDLDLQAGARTIILGRTLAGKTSLLRIMAGLDRPTTGSVVVDGVDVTGVSVRKRSVAMVYQQFINYPSQTIYQNIASPLRIAGRPKDEIEAKVHEAAKMLHIEDMLDRLPAELSGGQQQRCAIARALVKDVQLLLLDEPLVNLDYKLREELREELQGIFEERDCIVVYTTTEPTEALMLGGNIVVMDEGRVLQTGLTPEVYNNPASTKVAEVFNDPPINFIPGKVENAKAVLGQGLELPLVGGMSGLDSGEYMFGVRSSKLSLTSQDADAVSFRGGVELSEINGSETFIHMTHAGSKVVVQEDGIRGHDPGTQLDVFVNPYEMYVFDTAGQLLVAPVSGR